MDEPETPANDEAIRRGDSFRVGPERVDHSTLELAEELGRRFKVDEAIGIVELNFQHGHFEFAWLKRRVQKAQLPDAE